MIESFDPITLPLYAVALYAAAMYPLGLIFGAECSLCCCQKCTGCNCCGTDYARPTGFCCEGQWRLPGTGSCCGGEWRATEDEAGGQCCDGVWHTTGTCCTVPTVPLYITSTFGGVEACNALARGKIILTNGRTTITAVLQHGGSGYARVVDDVVEVATVTIISLNNLSGTYATLAATIDDDPDSETFGQITALTITNPGGGYSQWYAPPQDHHFPDSEAGTCCGNDWRTDTGQCCNAVWYPDASPCPAGQVFISKSEHCCGCMPDTIYDPVSAQMVPTADNLGLVNCPDCGLQSFPYSQFSAEGVDQGPIGRCCAPGGSCSYTFEDDCSGTWEEKCCTDEPQCVGPCCRENNDGVSSCEMVPTNECHLPDILSGQPDCETSCKGACCVDGESIGMLTQSECDAADGCWAGIGQETCRSTSECRPPFTPNCCESVVSDASGLTFTQPRRKRCQQTNRPWLVTVTGTTDSEIMIHGVPVGLTATPTKRCPFSVAFLICWDKFNIEPMPCNDSFRQLDVTVCWTPPDAAPGYLESLNYSGCNDITLWLGDCTRDCETTLVYAGPGVTVGGTVELHGSATLQANGGAIVFPSFTFATACNITITLDGTSDAANSVPAMANPTANTTLSIKKTGAGRWTLTAASTFTGATEILSGTLVVATNAPADGNGAFGYSLNGGVGTGSSPIVTLAGGAALLLNNGAQVGRIVAITGGSGAATIGGANTSGTTRFQSTMTFFVNHNLVLTAASGGTVDFANGWLGGAYGSAGPVGTNFTIGRDGNTGTVLLSGNLATTGTARVERGTLRVTGSIAADAGVTIDGSGAELEYRGIVDLASPVSLAQGTLAGNGTINTVSISNTPTLSVVSGDELVIDNELSGTGTLTKIEDGTLRITGSNTFSGTLNITAGEVVVTQTTTNPGSLVTSATFTSTTLSVAFTAAPTTGAQYVLLAGPTTQTYTPTLTGTTKTATYNAATATLTID